MYILQYYPYKHTTCIPLAQRCSVKKGVLKNFAKFAGKHLCQILFIQIQLY